MSRSSPSLAERFAPLGLAELTALAALQDRVDTKYLLPAAALDALLERLGEGFSALEIDGRREFGYRTTYYDTAELVTLHEHLQGRRRRFKVRKRRYVDSGVVRLEVKLKGRRGRTVKHTVTADPGDRLTAREAAFVRERLLDAYGRDLADARLRPTLVVACRRITLAAPSLQERVTLDLAVELGGARLVPGHAIIESKSLRGDAAADRVLRELGIRPVERCSKYCIGLALAQPEVRANHFRPLLRRYFEPADPRADERALARSR